MIPPGQHGRLPCECKTAFTVGPLCFHEYSAFTGSGFCPVPGHVILTCKLHVSGKI